MKVEQLQDKYPGFEIDVYQDTDNVYWFSTVRRNLGQNLSYSSKLCDTFDEAKRKAEEFIEKQNAFHQLSWHCLLFLLDRTDFSEFHFTGGGFATSVKNLLLKAA